MNDRGRVLLAGETWLTYAVHQKGFNAYTTGGYHEGQAELVEALESKGWKVTHIPNHQATEDFPWTAADLGAYDVVMLSDIGADTLQLHPDTLVRGRRTPDRLEAVVEFVGGGGGLLMVGGYMSFSGFEGRARFHGTALEGPLHVRMLGYDDRRETPAGATPEVRKAHHPVLAGVPADWPHFLGYNRVEPDGGEVLLAFRDDPLLVVGDHGAGRTAAFTSDCSPHWGSPEFMAWDGYAPFWDGLVSWLAGAAEGRR